MQDFEISTDRNRFRDDCAVIEHKRWHSLQWVDRRIFRSLMLHSHDIDLFRRHRDDLFREKNAHAAWVRRHLAVIELHAELPVRYRFLFKLSSRTWAKTSVKGDISNR